MGIQLYKKKDDICFPFSPGPLQACPSLQNMAYVYYTIYFPVLNFSFLFPLSFCEGVSETRLYWKQQDNGYLQVAAKIMRFSPRGDVRLCCVTNLEILGKDLFHVVKCKQYIF